MKPADTIAQLATLLLLACGPTRAADTTPTATLAATAAQFTAELTLRIRSDTSKGQGGHCGDAWRSNLTRTRRLARELGTSDWLLSTTDGNPDLSRFADIYQRVGTRLRQRIGYHADTPGDWFPPDEHGYPASAWDRPIELHYRDAGVDFRSLTLPPAELRRYRRHLAGLLAEQALTTARQCGDSEHWRPADLSTRHLWQLVRVLARYSPTTGRALLDTLSAQLCAIGPTTPLRTAPLAFALFQHVGELVGLTPRLPDSVRCPRLTAAATNLIEDAMPTAGNRRQRIESRVMAWHGYFLFNNMIDAASIQREAAQRGHAEALTHPPETPAADYQEDTIAFLLTAAEFLSLTGDDDSAANIVQRLLIWERAVKDSGLRLRNPARGNPPPYPDWLGLVYTTTTSSDLLARQNGELTPAQLDEGLHPLSRKGFVSGMGEQGLWWNLELAVRR